MISSPFQYPISIGLAVALSLAVPASPVSARDPSPAIVRQHLLAAVKSWGYQLQKLDVAALAASPLDLLVIDHAPDRAESVELMFRRAELEKLKTKPDGSRRLVLAYVSIGEAERYRFYWDESWLTPGHRPTWLGPVNPKWVGNYPVEFWQPEWQHLIFGASDSYIERVLDAGFDGVYLDRADVYQEFAGRPTAQAEMETFLIGLATHVRSLKPEALVVLQNAEELIQSRGVRKQIDAIAKESLYLNPDPSIRVPQDETEASLTNLRLARKVGRKVLVVEYTGDPVLALAARRKADAEGFVIHFTERSLSELNARGPDQQITAGVGAPALGTASLH